MLYYSSGIVPVSLKEDEPEFLMLRSWNQWDFPKGKLDDGEDYLETAKREAYEEAGITEVYFKWGLSYIDTLPYKTKVNGKGAKKISRYFVAEHTAGEIVILPNPETGIIEHDEFKWMSDNEIKKTIKLTPRISEVLEWAIKVINS